MAQIRAPHRPLDCRSEADSQMRVVSFRHPAYPCPARALLELPAVDDGGVRFDLALCACGILAGNRFAGSYFTTVVRRGNTDNHDNGNDNNNNNNKDDSNQEVVIIDRPPAGDGLLRASTYTFHVSNSVDATASLPYPVVPSFDHWVFPHGRLPAPWNTASIPSDAVSTSGSTARARIVARDQTCRITASYLESEHAHIVPSAASAWFALNQMFRYIGPDVSFPEIDAPANGLLLRHDLRSLFNKRLLAIFPAPSPPASAPPSSSSSPSPAQDSNFAIHVLDSSYSRGGHECRARYHNLALQPLRSVSVELLFARFAWTILCDERVPFFRTFGERFDVAIREGGIGKPVVRRGLDAGQVRNLPGMPGAPPPRDSSSRSVSPRRRSKPVEHDDHEVISPLDPRMFSFFGSQYSVHPDDGEEDSCDRGRKRRRRGSLD